MISNTNLRAHRIAGLQPGPRLIVTGAVHGNETAGTQGIRRVLDEIDHGEIEIPRGVVTFVPVCNPLAYNHQRRMGERNLNRRLQPTATPQDNEDRIAGVLCKWLAEHDVLLDLHSFRSPGQPFVMRGPADNRGTLEPFAHAAAEAQLAAHVGPNRVVEGWMQAYADGVARRKARGLTPGAVHEDPSYGVGTTESVSYTHLDVYKRQVQGRAMLVKRLTPLPCEAVVRGYVAGSGWKEYSASGTVCGIRLPAGLTRTCLLYTSRCV